MSYSFFCLFLWTCMYWSTTDAYCNCNSCEIVSIYLLVYYSATKKVTPRTANPASYARRIKIHLQKLGVAGVVHKGVHRLGPRGWSIDRGSMFCIRPATQASSAHEKFDVWTGPYLDILFSDTRYELQLNSSFQRFQWIKYHNCISKSYPSTSLTWWN